MNTEKLKRVADELFAKVSEWKIPADKFMNEFFRNNRWIGSKERRFVYDEVYKRIRALGLSPEWLKIYLPQNFSKELEALAKEAPTDLRVNTLKTTRSRLKLDAQPTPRAPNGLRLTKRQALQQNGDYEVQDEGSQLVSLYIEAKPGDRVLDYCAGAGGKSLALAAEMENNGTIIAHDISRKKLVKLKNRAEKAGATIIRAQEPKGEFNIVVVDAPCSGIGTWRRQPDAKWRLSDDKLQGYIQLQKQILYEASHFVKPKGRLVYITCSLLPIENEEQIKTFLKENPGFEKDREPLKLSPVTTSTDGFFAASLIRKQ